jgi:membrane dipeptidase
VTPFNRFLLTPALASALLIACSPSETPAPAVPLVETTSSQTNAPEATTPETEQQLTERARGIHERVITLDTHADINTANFTLDNNYTMDLSTQVTLPKMIEGGLDVAWFIVYTGQGPLTEEGYAAAYANAIDKFTAIQRLVTEIAPDTIEVAYTSDDVRRIDASGKKVAMIGIENAYPMGTDIGKVREFYELGGRYMSLAHNGHSQFADSNTGEASGEWLHNGLSELGRQAVAEMNKWGIIIDVSHPSMEANKQTIELSRAPVMASHSSARALDPTVSRNLWDEELLAIRDNGGIVHAVAFRSYLDSAKHAANRAALLALQTEIAAGLGYILLTPAEVRELDAEARATYNTQLAEINTAAAPRIAAEVDAVAPPVDVVDFVDHIDYMVKLIGIDHVGISSDFDGGGGIEGWQDASETFNVTLELARRGYSEEDIAKLWSENLFRVMDEVARIAEEIQAAEGV